MKKGWLLLVIGMVVLFGGKAFAGDSVWVSAQSDQYGKKMGGMLGRGLVNVATCFVDIITHTVEGTKSGPPFVGTLTGLGSGIGCSALRVSSGALDVVTFWVPGFNGIPIGRSYYDCLEVEETPAAATEAAPAYNPPSQPQAAVVETAAPPVARRHHDPMDYVKK